MAVSDEGIDGGKCDDGRDDLILINVNCRLGVKRIVVRARGELNVPGVPILRILKGEALRNSVTGEARLEGDTLYAVLEGPDESVERLLKFLPMASPAIKIREMEIREEDYTGKYHGFKITPS